jgi:sulfate adenylyltransferase subunit 1 (EFTu-like GTPase family)
MSDKLVSTDIPTWLLTIIKKINYDRIDFASNLAIKLYMNNLPKKTSTSYDVKLVSTTVPSDVIELFNSVDYKTIEKNKAKELEKFLTDYVKKNGLV